MSLSGIAEQITLDSGETELANVTPNKDKLKNVTLELVQVSKFHKTQRQVRVFDHKVLYIKEKVGKLGRHILLDLALMDENPVTVREFSLVSLVACGVTGLVAAITFFLALNGLVSVAPLYMYGTGALLTLISASCLFLTARSFKNTLVFKTIHGRVSVMSLFKNDPNKAKFTQFTKALINNIELARANSQYSKSKFIPAIVGEHRRLFEKQFITQEQFDQAKQNILSSNK